MTQAPDARPPLRRDAARNRELLVKAAADAFGEEGLAASVNAIAAAAGVNVATLYRNFPTKDHLIAAVLDTVMEPLQQASRRAIESPDADGVLATFVRETTRGQAHHRGVADALAGAPLGEDVVARLRETASAFVRPVVEQAHARGELRPEFTEVDVLISLRMLSAVLTVAEQRDRDVDRFVDLVIRGLRPD